MPWLSEFIGILGAGPTTPLVGTELLLWGLRTVLDWAHMNLVMLCAMRCSVALWTRGVAWLDKVPHLLVAFGLIPVLVCIMALAWIPFQLSLTLTDPSSLAGLTPLLPFLTVLALDIYLFKPLVAQERPSTDVSGVLANKVGKTSTDQCSESDESVVSI